MILSAQSIRRYCIYDAMINPFTERGVEAGKSYGLTAAGYDIRVGKVGIGDDDCYIRLDPGDFILVSSLERIKMPKNLQAIVHDKSSWARKGLCVQNTVLEPGWEGYITLELSFHRPKHHVVVHEGDPIAQLVFHVLDEETELPYKGKYQNQPDRPVEAIHEELTGTPHEWSSRITDYPEDFDDQTY